MKKIKRAGKNFSVRVLPVRFMPDMIFCVRLSRPFPGFGALGFVPAREAIIAIANEQIDAARESLKTD